MARILIFGGTFDPVHIGHLMTAKTALDSEKCEYEEVWFMPCYINLLKPSKIVASPSDRMVMCDLALKYFGDKRMKLIDFEIKNKIEAGTYIILNKLLKDEKYSVGNEFGFLIGSDQALSLRKWRNSRKLTNLLPFVVVGRPPRVHHGWGNWWNESSHVFIEPKYKENTSSTMIRQSLSEGMLKEVANLCTPYVAEYIFEKGLYQGEHHEDRIGSEQRF